MKYTREGISKYGRVVSEEAVHLLAHVYVCPHDLNDYRGFDEFADHVETCHGVRLCRLNGVVVTLDEAAQMLAHMSGSGKEPKQP